ncbi:hypothetical protein SAMN02799630_04037 [Paenibacillus sp. UNCCL117]|uniref:hypothetical protein n=1 Tax=unclassified Paenibacillus TaxID=185978 RepID=UPI000886D611|nr:MULTISPECIES: hypothetical protein [unclassified Paenibacillus]SDD78620.1 hypothetical protein SAMN04488602_113102 [Paenibacillus sp. cl123]SFW53011.1 hypothetical protein SAMN02799630_04037 [Paenibacillus sp. UNCCL117]
MRDFRTLRLLDRLRPVFERLNVDYVVMRKILQVKLTMDRRRVPTLYQAQNKKAGKRDGEENYFLKSLWIYIIMGLLTVPFVVIGDHFMFQMLLVFSVLMFMLMTSMISDFSAVLLDIRDKPILLTRPVNARTATMAKAVHIAIYLSFLTGALTIGPLIAGAVRHGIGFAAIFALEIILMDVLVLVLTALAYLFILRFFDGEKLKDMINYVQIVLTVMMSVGYQLAVRSFEFSDMLRIEFSPAWWQLLLPPVWFGAPYELLLHGRGEAYTVAFSVLALVVPLAALVLYVRLMPAFERGLQKLSHQGGTRRQGKGGLMDRAAKLVCRSKEERSFFRFAASMMSQEREFKLKAYPSLGFSIVFPFLFLLNGLRGNEWAEIAAGRSYLIIYFTMIVIPTVAMLLRYSGTYKGAWLFKAVPLANLAPVFKGTLKAFLIRLYFPVYVIVGGVFAVLFGARIIPDLIAVLLGSLLYTVLCWLMLGKRMPFTEPFSSGSGEGLKVLPLLLLLGAFLGAHFAATWLAYGVYLYMALLLGLNALVWSKAFNRVRL